MISSTRRSVLWRSPSRHEGIGGQISPDDSLLVAAGELGQDIPANAHHDDEQITIKGGRERGLVIHKLIEEVLTGETQDAASSLEARARTLLSELGIAEGERPEDGPHAPELAASVRRAFAVPEVVGLRNRLLPEMTVFAAEREEQGTIYVGGIADALAFDADQNVDVVIDWKSDVEPKMALIDLYREQVRDYLAATGGKEGLLVFVTNGRVERVLPR